MYEKGFQFSATEDGNATQPPMEGRTLQSRPKDRASKGSQAIQCDRNDRQYLISWRPSIYFQLLIAWLMIFGILVTVRNFSPAGLSSWIHHFPVRNTALT